MLSLTLGILYILYLENPEGFPKYPQKFSRIKKLK